jgi:hypothetical protein
MDIKESSTRAEYLGVLCVHVDNECRQNGYIAKQIFVTRDYRNSIVERSIKP